MKKLIIVVDLGHFKVYSFSKKPLESTRIELLKSYDTIEGHGRLGEKLSDEAGRFGQLGGKKGMKGYGEPHNIKLEIRKKLIKHIADDIDNLIKNEQCNEWYFAAGKNVNKQILESINPSVKKKLKKNLLSDLTKEHKTELLSRFKIV